MYNGWTPTLSEKVLIATERATLEVFVAEQPKNEYWRGMLEAFNKAHPVEQAYQIEHEAEASTADEWLSYLDANPDPRTAEQIALDEWQAESALTRESDRPY